MARDAPIRETDNWFIGEDQLLRFTIDDGAIPTPAASDITGFALEWVLRLSPGGPVALIAKTTGAGIVITDGPNGVCEVAIDDGDTINLQPSARYFHTLRRTDAGFETVLAFGDAVLRQAATR